MPYPLTLATILQRNRILFGKKEILDFLATRVAKWRIPDEVIFVDAIPKTSVGKSEAVPAGPVQGNAVCLSL